MHVLTHLFMHTLYMVEGTRHPYISNSSLINVNDNSGGLVHDHLEDDTL